MQRPIFLFVSLFFAVSAASAQMPVPLLPNVAHRGAHTDKPENTLSAFRQAVAEGADGAECDVYRTQDGVLIISHDESPKRMTGVDGNLTKMTLAEVKQLDVKGGEKIPTLAEYLAVLKGTHTKPVIEIKQPGIAKDVIEEVQRTAMTKEATIISFNADEIKTVRKLAPAISAALLVGKDKNSDNTSPEVLIAKAKDVGTDILDLDYHLLTKDTVAKLQAAGITVWAWTVNDPKKMKELLEWGVHSITTDKPDVLADVLKER